MMPIEFDKTLLAAKQVMDARNFVDGQKARIARLKAVGTDTQDAERTLELLEANLRTFEDHLDKLKSGTA
jgi:hypothetical protein